MDNLQLEINFSERRNRFRDALNAGEFVLLVENSSPGRDNDPAGRADRLAALENAVSTSRGSMRRLRSPTAATPSTSGAPPNTPAHFPPKTATGM